MQAVHLMEMANAASLTGGLRNYRQTVSFVVYDRSTGAPTAGTFTRLSAGSAGHRDEITFGDYHSTRARSEEHTSELQSRRDLVCRLLLEKKNKIDSTNP